MRVSSLSKSKPAEMCSHTIQWEIVQFSWNCLTAKRRAIDTRRYIIWWICCSPEFLLCFVFSKWNLEFRRHCEELPVESICVCLQYAQRTALKFSVCRGTHQRVVYGGDSDRTINHSGRASLRGEKNEINLHNGKKKSIRLAFSCAHTNWDGTSSWLQTSTATGSVCACETESNAKWTFGWFNTKTC